MRVSQWSSYGKEIYTAVLYWTLATVLILCSRFVGIEFFYTPKFEAPFSYMLLSSLPGGVATGVIFGLLEVFYKQRGHLKTSFGKVVGSRTLIYIAIFMVEGFFASWIGSDSLELAMDYMTSTFTLMNFLLFSIAAFFFHFFKQMGKKFGPGIITSYLTGKYFQPQEEDRVFMFLDLKSSTTIAEKLSHVLYSKLIQDCFYELTGPILKNKGEIYQYVGDEAVITWKQEDGLEAANCLNFFFDFKDRLEKKKTHFLKEYQTFPEFKAGIGMGQVTVAEVGELKTEIAYHGDVLNATARIQGLCNQFEKAFLASASLVQALEGNKGFTFECVGEVELRGKAGTHKVYSCEKRSE